MLWSPRQDDELIRMFKADAPYRDMADRFGITENAAKIRIKRLRHGPRAADFVGVPERKPMPKENVAKWAPRHPRLAGKWDSVPQQLMGDDVVARLYGDRRYEDARLRQR